MLRFKLEMKKTLIQKNNKDIGLFFFKIPISISHVTMSCVISSCVRLSGNSLVKDRAFPHNTSKRRGREYCSLGREDIHCRDMCFAQLPPSSIAQGLSCL